MTRTAAPLVSQRMTFLMIVDDAEIARYVHRNGVSRLFVDLEYMGKDLRQKHLDSWKSRQEPRDVSRIREAVPDGHLLVRVNPLHDGSANEIEDVLARGADSVMLPMFRTVDDLSRFLDMVGGHAEAVPLVETADALRAVPEIADRLSLTRLHFGLNDLHLDMKLDFMFEPLAKGMLEDAAAALRSNGIAFGIGGVARAGEGIVSPENLLGEHVRLGSDAAILSRTLHRRATDLSHLQSEMDFPKELARLQQIYADFLSQGPEQLEQNRTETADRIQAAVQTIRNKRAG